MSYAHGSWWFNSEYIVADFDTGTPRLELDLDFYYWTLGYNLSEQVLAYISYWDTEAHELAESSTTAPEDELQMIFAYTAPGHHTASESAFASRHNTRVSSTTIS